MGIQAIRRKPQPIPSPEPIKAEWYAVGMEDGFLDGGTFYPNTGPVPRSMTRVPVMVVRGKLRMIGDDDRIVTYSDGSREPVPPRRFEAEFEKV